MNYKYLTKIEKKSGLNAKVSYIIKDIIQEESTKSSRTDFKNKFIYKIYRLLDTNPVQIVVFVGTLYILSNVVTIIGRILRINVLQCYSAIPEISFNVIKTHLSQGSLEFSLRQKKVHRV